MAQYLTATLAIEESVSGGDAEAILAGWDPHVLLSNAGGSRFTVVTFTKYLRTESGHTLTMSVFPHMQASDWGWSVRGHIVQRYERIGDADTLAEAIAAVEAVAAEIREGATA